MPGAPRTAYPAGGPAWRGRAALVAVMLAAATASLAPVAALAAAPSSRPATAPAGDPLEELLTPPTQPAPRPADPAETVERALAYTDREKVALEDVRDRDGQLDGVALSILLRRAAMLPEGRAVRNEADRPNLKNLWRTPADYRGKLIYVEGLYAAQRDWSEYASPTTYHSGPVHMMVLQEDATGQGRALMVLMSRKPPENIPEGRRLPVAGLFYKVVRLEEEDARDGKRTDYAVIAARGLYSTAGVGSPGGIPGPLMILVGAVVALLMVLLFIRRRAARRPAEAAEYKPMRFEDTAEGRDQPPPESDQVDEDLVRQVEAFRDRKKTPGGEDRCR